MLSIYMYPFSLVIPWGSMWEVSPLSSQAAEIMHLPHCVSEFSKLVFCCLRCWPRRKPRFSPFSESSYTHQGEELKWWIAPLEALGLHSITTYSCDSGHSLMQWWYLLLHCYMCSIRGPFATDLATFEVLPEARCEWFVWWPLCLVSIAHM